MSFHTFPSMPDVLPEGQIGLAKVEHYEVSKEASTFTVLRSFSRPDEYVPPGKYARLLVGSTLMMSDTAMERRSNFEVVRRARGHVFIAGLGLGMILHPILKTPEVTRVTVVEKYGDVIRLVAPTLPCPEKLEIIEADVFDWKPAKGQKFEVIYHDIWPHITLDNLPEMSRLHRRFGRYLAPGGWQSSWMHKELQARARREKRNPRSWW